MRKEVNVTHSCFYQLLQPCLATILPQFTLLSLSLCHSFFPLWGTLSPDGCSLASGKNVLLLPIYIHLTSYTYAVKKKKESNVASFPCLGIDKLC